MGERQEDFSASKGSQFTRDEDLRLLEGTFSVMRVRPPPFPPKKDAAKVGGNDKKVGEAVSWILSKLSNQPTG